MNKVFLSLLLVTTFFTEAQTPPRQIYSVVGNVETFEKIAESSTETILLLSDTLGKKRLSINCENGKFSTLLIVFPPGNYNDLAYQQIDGEEFKGVNEVIWTGHTAVIDNATEASKIISSSTNLVFKATTASTQTNTINFDPSNLPSVMNELQTTCEFE